MLHREEAVRLTGVSFHPTAHFVTSVAESSEEVSSPILARLMNLCSVAAYLLGDAEGEVSCLRASLALVPLREEPSDNGTEFLSILMG